MQVKFLRMHPNTIIPVRGTDGSAGYDLFTVTEVTLAPGDRMAIPLGFATDMPREIHGRIESRSGMALRGLVVLTGVIDSDYRGEWKVIMQNFSTEEVVFPPGARIAQVVFRPTMRVAFSDAESLSVTSRDAGGFGSTGS